MLILKGKYLLFGLQSPHHDHAYGQLHAVARFCFPEINLFYYHCYALMPWIGEVGVKSLAAHQNFFQQYIEFLETAFIGKKFNHRRLDLLKKSNLYLEYFLRNVIVTKT